MSPVRGRCVSLSSHSLCRVGVGANVGVEDCAADPAVTPCAEYLAPPTRVALFALVVGGLSAHSIAQHGIDYVAQPRLARKALDEVLAYEGKGFESGRRGRGAVSAGKVKTGGAGGAAAVGGAKMVSVEEKTKRTQARKESHVLPMLATPVATKQD